MIASDAYMLADMDDAALAQQLPAAGRAPPDALPQLRKTCLALLGAAMQWADFRCGRAQAALPPCLPARACYCASRSGKGGSCQCTPNPNLDSESEAGAARAQGVCGAGGAARQGRAAVRQVPQRAGRGVHRARAGRPGRHHAVPAHDQGRTAGAWRARACAPGCPACRPAFPGVAQGACCRRAAHRPRPGCASGGPRPDAEACRAAWLLCGRWRSGARSGRLRPRPRRPGAQVSLRPILHHLAYFNKLKLPLLRGLARLLTLFSNWFNVTLGARLRPRLRARAGPAARRRRAAPGRQAVTRACACTQCPWPPWAPGGRARPARTTAASRACSAARQGSRARPARGRPGA